MSDYPFSLFISSRMEELVEERRAVQEAVAAYQMFGWLWERVAGARPESVRETYLRQVEDCDLYIGLFWLGYGPYTIEEYEHARVCGKPCLIYEKQIDVEKRDPLLKAFLGGVKRVGEGVTVCRFETPEELARRVQQDVQRVLVDSFRHQQRRKQQDDQPHTPPTSISIKADHGSIAGYNVYNPKIDNYRQKD